jgi:hypothetical protein
MGIAIHLSELAAANMETLRFCQIRDADEVLWLLLTGSNITDVSAWK